jgi:hypothetical protein
VQSANTPPLKRENAALAGGARILSRLNSAMSLTQIGQASKRVVQRAAKLQKPIVVSEFFCNRRGETVRVSLREYEGVAIVDARRFYTAKDGVLRPRSKGLAIAIRRLPELAAAITKALSKARELGLIPPPVQP